MPDIIDTFCGTETMTGSSTGYQQQLDQKIELTRQEFSEFYHGKLEVFPSPDSCYRMRAEFKAWQEDGEIHYAMFRPGEYKKPYIIKEFEPGSARMQELMPNVRAAINDSEILRRKLFQIEFLTSTTGDAVVTLIYHKPLTEQWQEEADVLARALAVSIIGRSRKQKLVIGRDYVLEEFAVTGETLRYQQVEGSFTQPNATICNDMLNWVCTNTATQQRDLLELYCGNGNFTLPLARRFQQVLATEVSKTSIKSALYNCDLNDTKNVTFVRMSSEELTQAFTGERPFRRLKDIKLENYQFSSVFVDPPRAGLDEGTSELVQRFDNIIYISCNPETLKRDLQSICRTHTITHMALFDQFPFTPHRECGVLLHRH